MGVTAEELRRAFERIARSGLTAGQIVSVLSTPRIGGLHRAAHDPRCATLRVGNHWACTCREYLG